MKAQATFGFTLNLGNFQSYRVDIGISELDTSLPLEPQLEECRPYIEQTAEWCQLRLAEHLEKNGLLERVRDRRA